MPFDGIPYRDSRAAASAAHGKTLDTFNKQLQRINNGLTAITDIGSATVQSLAYTYDDNDNARIIRNNTALNTTETLRFDSVDRLVFASGGYGTVSSITYDSNGNRLTYGGTTYTISGTSNRLTNDGTNAVGYIATGNINSIGANSMTYNKANQLATATVSGTTSTYTYDAFGQRAKYVVGAGTAVVQQYDPDMNLLMEKGSAETDYVYLDGAPIAAIAPATPATSYIHYDHLGTPKKATNSSQTVVWTGTYQPFGTVTPTASVTMNLRFPGQYSDSTGFYHNGYRDYVPLYGRYLESDPIGLNGGINTYSYVLNNPFSYIDPWGLKEVPNDTIGPLKPEDWWAGNPNIFAPPKDKYYPNDPQCFQKCNSEQSSHCMAGTAGVCALGCSLANPTIIGGAGCMIGCECVIGTACVKSAESMCNNLCQ